MKKVILSIAGSLLIGVFAFAQDSTRTNSTQQSQQTVPQQPTQQPTQQQQPALQTFPQPQQQPATQPIQSLYRRDDMKVIPQDQLPESLRQTLRGNEYQGWEKSTIMQNPTTGEYLLELNTPVTQPNNTNPNTLPSNQPSQPRVYRFDSNGQVIMDKNKSGLDKDN
jgi:hypothetical protein